MRIEEGVGTQVKGTESIFKKLIEKKSWPKAGYSPMKAQEV